MHENSITPDQIGLGQGLPASVAVIAHMVELDRSVVQRGKYGHDVGIIDDIRSMAGSHTGFRKLEGKKAGIASNLKHRIELNPPGTRSFQGLRHKMSDKLRLSNRLSATNCGNS